MDALDVAVRFALYADLAVAFGVPFFALCASRARSALPLARILLAAGVVGVALSALGLTVTAAGMAGVPVAQVDLASVMTVLTGMSLGKAVVARVTGLMLVAVSAAFVRRRPSAALALASIGGTVAIGSLAWGGHGAMDDGAIGWLHLGADIAHLVAAGTWIGALVCLLLLVTRPIARSDAAHLRLTHRALDGFSTIGTAVVAVIVATGLVNAWLLVGPANVLALPSSAYGQLLIAKIALFAAMLGFAAANRYRLTPALAAGIDDGDYRGAVVALRVSVALETGCAVVVLVIVAWLGTLQPPASAM